MYQLITPTHKREIFRLAKKVGKVEISEFVIVLEKLIEQIRTDIPKKKRISYGRYSIIKQLGLEFYPLLIETDTDVCQIAFEIFKVPEYDPFVRSLAIQLISIYGLKSKNLSKVLSVFEKAATD